MKKFVAGFFAGAIVMVIGALGYPRLGLLDVRSDARVSDTTARLLYFGIHASVRRTAPMTPNPLPRNDETLIAGGKLYMNNCVGCHGEPGIPPSNFGTTFHPPAPQFPVPEQNIRKRKCSGLRSMESAERAWRRRDRTIPTCRCGR